MGLLHASYSAVKPMASYRALDLGAGSVELGVLAASFAILPLFLAFVVGRWADILGPTKLVVAGSVLLVAGSVGALLAGAFAVLLISCAALGFAHLLQMVGAQTIIAHGGSETARDRGFGTLTAAASVGQMLGPALALGLAGWLVVGSFSAGEVGLAVAALLALLGLPLCAHIGGRSGAPPGEQASSRRALSVLVRTEGMWPAMISSGTVLAALDLLMTFLPAWAEERGISVATVGWLLALRALVSVVSRVFVVRLIAWLSRRWTFVGSLVMGVVGLALLPFVDIAGAVVVMVLLGVGLGLAQPLTLSWVSTLAAPNVRGAAIGLRLTANRLGQTLLPPAIGVAVAGSGSSGVFLGSAAVLAAATGTVLRRRLHEPPSAGP
jgi:MFS family permease